MKLRVDCWKHMATTMHLFFVSVLLSLSMLAGLFVREYLSAFQPVCVCVSFCVSITLSVIVKNKNGRPHVPDMIFYLFFD